MHAYTFYSQNQLLREKVWVYFLKSCRFEETMIYNWKVLEGHKLHLYRPTACDRHKWSVAPKAGRDYSPVVSSLWLPKHQLFLDGIRPDAPHMGAIRKLEILARADPLQATISPRGQRYAAVSIFQTCGNSQQPHKPALQNMHPWNDNTRVWSRRCTFNCWFSGRS